MLLHRDDSQPLAVQIENAYTHGCSDIEVCKLMRITMPEFKNYYDTNSDFRKLVDVGRTMSQAYWYEQGRENIVNNKFNTSLWMFNMKNRFGWSERAEVINHDPTTDNLDSLKSQLQELLPNVVSLLNPEMSQSELLAKLEVKGNS